ncbi:MAG: lytic murein transglycosylase [Candidatus Magasanikbacteria bacterium]|nr:lytic murein transglycosylase [Candidatus Magasanikbacteria bacterium]
MNKSLTVFLATLAIFFSSVLFWNTASADDLAAQQQLEQELKNIEAQITALEGQIATTSAEKKTLANKIAALKKQQASLVLKIKATSIRLNELNLKLNQTEEEIAVNVQKSNRIKSNLSEVIRFLNQKDRTPFLFTLVNGGGIGALLQERTDYERLTTELKKLVDELSGLKSDLEQKQTELSDQHDETNQLLRLSTAQQSALNGALVEQASLLTETKGREAAYQQLLADNKKRAAEIKSRLYELLGVGTQINFGQAVSIASLVEKQTGVPKAFLLAILTQESNLGKNVGTCNRPGDPPEKSWKVVMKPTRDQGPFKEITKALGRDTDITPVSCPMKRNGKQIGWGGAMGPAQFIPSTWMGYKDKVTAITGKAQADPWDIRDAFIAAALLLKNNGADSTKDGQWKAAMRYFSGGTNPAYRFYGDNVLATTAKYEQDIKDLGQ